MLLIVDKNIFLQRSHILKNDELAWVCDLRLSSQNNKDVNVQAIGQIFEETFLLIWDKKIENDAFNKLVVFTATPWKEINFLRAYAKYMRQICLPFSQSYIEACLIKHPKITRRLIKFFNAKFSLGKKMDQENLDEYRKDFVDLLDKVLLLDEDKIFRKYFELIEYTVRTNFNIRSNKTKTLALKLNSSNHVIRSITNILITLLLTFYIRSYSCAP